MKTNKLLKYTLCIPTLIILTNCSINIYKPVEEEQEFLIIHTFNKLNYYIGESFTKEGLEVKNKKTNETITEYKLSIQEGYVFESSASYNVSILKDNYKTVVVDTITVTKEEIKTLSLEHTFDKLYYLVGESFSSSGLVIKDSSTNEVITDYKLTLEEGYVFNETKQYKIYASKEGYEDLYIDQIEVSEKQKLTIYELPAKTKYLINSNFSSEGLVIKNANNNEIITDYTLSVSNGTLLNQVGEISIKVSKDNFIDAIFKVNIYEKPILKIQTKPTKLSYSINDTFSLSGLVVKEDINGDLVTTYTSSIKEGETLTSIGTIEVIISKDGYESTSFNIEVSKGDAIGSSRTLSIYSINDTHGAFTRAAKSSDNAGMAYIGEYLKTQKENDLDNTILLSPGDMWQGGVESNNTRGKIMVDAMNIIGFDAMAIGNHEFDWGEEYILSNSKLANFPFISSNIFYSNGSYVSSWATPSVVLDKGGIKVGLIGAARNNMGSSITGSIASQFKFPDPVSYVKEESNKLRKQGVDVIILVTHDEGLSNSGYGNLGTQSTFYTSLTTINSDYNKKYVDAMFFSHDHKMKYGYDNSIPFVEGGCDGKYISKIEINVTKESSGYTVSSSTVEAPLNAVTTCTVENSEIAKLATEKYKDEIGDVNKVLYTFTKSYTSTEFTVIVCQAMYWYINSNLSYFGGEKVSLTSHNTGGIRGTVNVGDYTYSDLVSTCPFDNDICIQKSTSKQVSAIKSSSYYAYYSDSNISYSDGLATLGTISYIAESSYASRYQQSYTAYSFTAKEALIYYLEQLEPGLL